MGNEARNRRGVCVLGGKSIRGRVRESEKLRVSMAIGMAQNPRIRVILIENGSLCDKDSMNGILWADDRQILSHATWLYRKGEPSIEISVRRA